MLECCQYTKEAMICIDNKYGFIELTNFYQINQNLRTFTQNHVTGSIFKWGVVRLSILHTLIQDAVSSFYVRIRNKLD